MSAWSDDELRRIHDAEELAKRIIGRAPRRGAGTGD
jgi:hypothetical protein